MKIGRMKGSGESASSSANQLTEIYGGTSEAVEEQAVGRPSP
jgi:hypothetical protein